MDGKEIHKHSTSNGNGGEVCQVSRTRTHAKFDVIVVQEKMIQSIKDSTLSRMKAGKRGWEAPVHPINRILLTDEVQSIVKRDKGKRSSQSKSNSSKPKVAKPIELDVVLATQSVQFGPVGPWHRNYQCDWSIPKMYKDFNWDVYCCLPPAMKEYVSHYVGCHIPYDLAINVAKKNMIEF